MAKAEPLYRILFVQQDKLYEIYAEFISEETLIGFIEAENILFKENGPTQIVDPNEEKLKTEFKAVKRSYIPLHTIIRIDEVVKEGPSIIRSIEGDNISHFPNTFQKKTINSEKT